MKIQHPYLINDEFNKSRNPDLYDLVESFIGQYNSDKPVEESDIIVVIGGDGSLLQAIKKFKHLNIPFIGIHGGTVGYYMNNLDCSTRSSALKELKKEFDLGLDLLTFPTLQFEAINKEGDVIKDTFFNDVTVDRATAATPTIKMNIKINNYDMGKLIMGDGMLFATPAGSTAYAKNLGGFIIPYSVKAYQMVPKACSVDKHRLRAMPLNFGDKVELTLLDTDFRRPLVVFDGTPTSEDFVPVKLIISKSDQKVRLAFFSEKDFVKNAFTWHFMG